MTTEKQLRRPIIDPLLLVLKSRRMLVALSALLVSLLIFALPEVEVVREELLTLVITLALALIGGYSLEDAASAARQSQAPDALREQIREVVNVMIDDSWQDLENLLREVDVDEESSNPG